MCVYDMIYLNWLVFIFKVTNSVLLVTLREHVIVTIIIHAVGTLIKKLHKVE